MPTPSIFISYSHKDEDWKDRVVTHLHVLELEGMLDLWDDRRIEAGDEWYQEIQNAIAAASIAVLLISPDFLTSKFIMNEELPRLLERNAKVGLRIIPLVLRPCAWLEIKWLARYTARPKDGQPLSTIDYSQVEIELASIATELNQLLKRAGIRPAAQVFVPLPPDKISLAKLPSTHPDLFGRQSELKGLDDAWDNPQINVLSLVAWGGVGKSALVNKWLSLIERDNYRGAERVFGWSFYSQGAAEGRQVSADQFIAAALEWFGDADPTKGSPWDKGERLAELVKRERTLLILDGLEPLQNPPPVETGRIKDPALLALLRELARQNPGLVIITTRLAVDDLKDTTVIASPEAAKQSPNRELGIASSQKTFLAMTHRSTLQIDLDNLSTDAGAAYLKHLGVTGSETELKDAAKDFAGHALALTLLGSYLNVVHNGDVRMRKEIPHLTDEQRQGAHARRVMESYERFLRGKPELDILRLMGLFDRPAERGALDALRKPPAIESLTSNLQSLSHAQWQYAIKNLRDLRLLSQPDAHDPDTHDCHPLLREHFGEQLRASNPSAGREAHSRLYEYYKSVAKEFPDTVEEMAPLYAAVMHGCQAGRHQETLDEVFVQRIDRGRGEAFVVKKLGAMGSALSALSGFFDSPWHSVNKELLENSKSYVLSNAGFCLRALGRLAEAVQPMQASLDTYNRQENWKFAARIASNLSELYLTIGDVPQALAYAEQSVQLADRSGDADLQRAFRTSLADALHQAGRLAESEAAFHKADEMQKKRQPEFSLLYSLQGYRYCDLLLSQGDYAEVGRRASQTLEWAKQYLQSGGSLLWIALDNLSLGRAHLLQSQRDPSHPFTESANNLNRAVDSLRQAGTQHYLPRGLLACAEFYRVTGALDKAQKDLDEAFSIATRGGMGLHLADCHLEYARLSLRGAGFATKQSPSRELEIASQKTLAMTPDQLKDKAREHLAIAKKMIEEMGYHRRDGEVKELERETRE